MPKLSDLPDNAMNSILGNADAMSVTIMPVTPAGKLDADQFMAQDQDGITETLSGSGNLNFLMMQSAQTNGMARLAGEDPFHIISDAYAPSVSSGFMGPVAGLMTGAGKNIFVREHQGFGGTGNTGNDTRTGSDTYVSDNSAYTAPDPVGGDNRSRHNADDISIRNIDADGHDGTPARDGHDGKPGEAHNGADGRDGVDGAGGDTTINIVNIDGPVINMPDIHPGDILTKIVNIINDLPVLDDILDSGSPDHDIGIGGGDISLLGTDLGQGLLPLEPLDVLIDPVEDLVGDIDLGIIPSIDLLGGGETSNAAGDQDLGLDTHIDLLDHALGTLAMDIPLDPVEQLLNTDLDLDIGGAINLLGEIASPIIDPYAGGGAPGMPTGALGDAVSGLAGGMLGAETPATGDHDIGLGLGMGDSSILQTGLVLDQVENLLGDMDLGITPSITMGGEASNAAGDHDVMLNTNIGLLDGALGATAVDVPLDAVEQLLNMDIDLDVGGALNLLGDTSAPVLDTAEGGVADTLTDPAGALLSGLAGDAVGQLALKVENTNIDLGPSGVAAGDIDLNLPVDQAVTDMLDNLVTQANTALDTTQATTLLSQTVGTVTQAVSSVTDNALPIWPEVMLPSGSEAAASAEPASALPDPIGHIAEGLGVLDLLQGSQSPHHGLGGLFG